MCNHIVNYSYLNQDISFANPTREKEKIRDFIILIFPKLDLRCEQKIWFFFFNNLIWQYNWQLMWHEKLFFVIPFDTLDFFHPRNNGKDQIDMTLKMLGTKFTQLKG